MRFRFDRLADAEVLSVCGLLRAKASPCRSHRRARSLLLHGAGVRGGFMRTMPVICLLAFLSTAGACRAMSTAVAGTENLGPYSVQILAGGIGLTRPLAPQADILRSNSPWSLSGWVRRTDGLSRVAIVGGFGRSSAGGCDCVVLRDGKLQLWLNGGARLRTPVDLAAGVWYAVAATYDGRRARLYLDGRLIGSELAATAPARPLMLIAPVTVAGHFGGFLAHWRLHERALSAQSIRRLAGERPVFDLVEFYGVGVGWPLQKRSWRGLQHPQDPWTLPKSRAPTQRWKPHAQIGAQVPARLALRSSGQDTWVVNGWRLAAASAVKQSGEHISLGGFDDREWYAAVVPGTVLTTLVARGVYPDPYYGLNNLSIPESLSRQHYWYRTAFTAPPSWRGKQLMLRFDGVNYAAVVWLNGERLGAIRGAFIRGIFDVTGKLAAGRRNVLAVRVSPPPHPGIPYEKSIAAGPGGNGGRMALDGPTFIDTEGWDWMPPVRDRDTGIWQRVLIRATGDLLLRRPHVITRLPLPRTDEADVSIAVSVENRHRASVPAVLVARFGTVTVRDRLTLPPGRTRVRLTPRQFPSLHVRHPHLWWPNGYGEPYLYTLTLQLYARPRHRRAGRILSDRRTLHFGIREITYELSLFDHRGRLRRVIVDPTEGTLLGERRLIDVRHRAIKQTPNGWAASLTPAGEHSPAVRADPDSSALSPYLAIRVNGVRIAARGGNWGMDDALKRITRARLEPYFRLTRQAHLDIIRNWLGQNTEPVFYRLADEYGLLVLNDFWESTQNFQLQAENPQRFLANARDVIDRYRNHPSIALWFGRNEGVPQPILNRGLAHLVSVLDGTRLYLPSSNRINLQGSGPYDYRAPVQYFTTLARGFSVEVGTPSLASLRSLKSMMPRADLWPVSDDYAYHDWNFGGNGDVRVLMRALDAQLGTPRSLRDLERKAQLMDYVSYRAIFEGFNAHLWTENSGRLLWMTQPAWPSNIWQIYTADYDTAGAYFGVKEACQPLHVQMNLPDFSLAVVNTTRVARIGLTLRNVIVSLRGRVLAAASEPVSAAADAVTTLPPLDLARYLAGSGLVFVELRLVDRADHVLSENVYWQGRSARSQRMLNTLKPQRITVSAHRAGLDVSTRDRLVSIKLTNRGVEPAVAVKLTALDAHGRRVLPVYYSTNFVTLLRGESRSVRVRCPRGGSRCAQIVLSGWNVLPVSVAIAGGGRRKHAR